MNEPLIHALFLDTREDAIKVMDGVSDVFDRRGYVTLDDLYFLVNLPTVHTDSKWGWTTKPEFELVIGQDKVSLIIPKMEAI